MARLVSISGGGNTVSGEMFGANALFDTNTLTNGEIRAGYLDALMASGAQNVRFPGGMVEIDFNVMRMENGQLREELVNFLDDVRAVNEAGGELSVSIVLPTQAYIAGSEYADFVQTVSDQYGDVVSGFEIGNEYSLGARNPDGLFSEHPEDAASRPTEFGISETTYGQQVERIVTALNIGLRRALEDDALAASGFDPDILIQMSDIVGASSTFRGTGDHAAADRAILSQISSGVMALIDGYVGHYYYNESHAESELFDGDWREVRSFPGRIESWNDTLQDLFGSEATRNDLSFTEWNNNIRNVDQHGLKSASVLAKQFEYMIEMGTDSAFIWPLQHNTNTSISGHYADTVADLTPAGEVFSSLNNLLNPSLNGGQIFSLGDGNFSSLDNRLDVATYSSQYENVFVISNRSYNQVVENINFSSGISDILDGTLFTIGIDASSSDGLTMGGDETGHGRLARRAISFSEYQELRELPFFDASNPQHFKIVGGVYRTYLPDPAHIIPKFSGAHDIDDFWFLTESDVSASLDTQSNVLGADDGQARIDLDPFEVAIVRIEHIRNIEGTSSNNRLKGGAGADSILARGGNDTLFGYEGDDTLKGGWGNDRIDGGDGLNYLVGSVGDDVFLLSEGQSTIDGGSGIDTVDYTGASPSIRVDLIYEHLNARAAEGDVFSGIENVVGTSGADNIRGNYIDNHLSGGQNVDYIFGRRGDDTLDGGVGDDVLFGGHGADHLNGGSNRDRAQYSESPDAVTVDLQTPSANTGEAAGDTFRSIEDLAGSHYGDSLSGNSSSNRLFGRAGNDTLIGRGGQDYLNGGAGNDLLAGGRGNDILRGGGGSDVFLFSSGDDVIEDFNLAIDSLVFHTASFTGYELSMLEADDGDLILQIDETNSLTLLDVGLTEFVDHYNVS